MDMPEARRRFAALIAQPQGEFRLAEAALLIAQEEYPEMSIPDYLAQFDASAETVKTQLGFELDPVRIVKGINTHLFDEKKLRGNRDDYYDPRNSFINEVLNRGLGIPITLSVAYIEVARLLGVPISGVGMPGHFIVQYKAQPEPFWIDPFDRGSILTHEQCQARLLDMYGDKLPWNDAFLAPISDQDILWRMLNNLKMVYAQLGEHRRALGAIERMILIRPDLPSEIRDRGYVHYQLGHLQAALYDLRRYLELSQEAPDAPIIQRHIAALQNQLETS